MPDRKQVAVTWMRQKVGAEPAPMNDIEVIKWRLEGSNDERPDATTKWNVVYGNFLKTIMFRWGKMKAFETATQYIYQR